MAQNHSVDPMTPEQRREFAASRRIQAAQARAADPPDIEAAELHEWIAGNYERKPE